MSKLNILNAAEEKELLKLAQKGIMLAKEGKKVPANLSKATQLLTKHFLDFIKYIARGYYNYSKQQEQINHEDLMIVGVIALEKAIGKFDINSKHRFPTYAGYWIRQHIQSYIHGVNFISSSKKKIEEKEGEFIKENTRVIYYDRKLDEDKEEGAYSLIDELGENDGIEEKINIIETQKNINQLISFLKEEEALIIRLLYRIIPRNLSQIYQIAEKKEKKELQKFFLQIIESKKKKITMEEISFEKSVISESPIVKKYLKIFSKNKISVKEVAKITKKNDSNIRLLKKNAWQKIKILAEKKKLKFLIS